MNGGSGDGAAIADVGVAAAPAEVTAAAALVVIVGAVEPVLVAVVAVGVEAGPGEKTSGLWMWPAAVENGNDDERDDGVIDGCERGGRSGEPVCSGAGASSAPAQPRNQCSQRKFMGG
jgi:hypothetical protein